MHRNSFSMFDPAHDSIKVMTLHVIKGMDFQVVALVSTGRMPAEGEDQREKARLCYVGGYAGEIVVGANGGGKSADGWMRRTRSALRRRKPLMLSSQPVIDFSDCPNASNTSVIYSSWVYMQKDSLQTRGVSIEHRLEYYCFD